MSLEIPPGIGNDCTIADPVRDVAKAMHLHLDGKGFLKAFLGEEQDCPDTRKRRALKELQRPRSM